MKKSLGRLDGQTRLRFFERKTRAECHISLFIFFNDKPVIKLFRFDHISKKMQLFLDVLDVPILNFHNIYSTL